MLCLLLSGPLHRWHYQWDFESGVINSYTGVPPRLFAPPALLIVMLHCWIIKMRSRALLPTWGGWEAVLFRSWSQVNSQQIFIVEWLSASCLFHYCNLEWCAQGFCRNRILEMLIRIQGNTVLHLEHLSVSNFNTLILNCAGFPRQLETQLVLL